MEKFDTIVIGAGCAGLACATMLADQGQRVVVLEKRNILGGRACSYADPQTGEILDNGQHLLLGCYGETIAFLKRIGQERALFFHAGLRTPMVGTDASIAFLETFALPAPFHLLLGLLKYDALSLKDRLSVIYAASKMRKPKQRLEKISCSHWLDELGQSHDTREKFWDLIILATLNISPDKAPANLLQVVMQKGFMASVKASRVGLARVGLSDLYANPSKIYLEKKGGEVRSNQTVEEVLIDDCRVKGVRIFGGDEIEASNVICTVPPAALAKLKVSNAELQRHLEKSSAMIASPIVSFHFWSNAQPVDETYVGFWGTQFHWAFQKSKVYFDEGTKHWTLVASGADAMLDKSKEELIELAKKELSLLPAFRNITIAHAKIVFERQATWVPPLGNTSARLSTKTNVEGFYLAGDWTDTGFPCTIESAVLSGHRAAQAATGLIDHSQTLV